ncbi:hypothetical protein RhiirA4_457570 [Rhizophagus irregularis]|uniref:ATP-dependent DNA helicase n=1 Tax=Rhizophagus irregularis TaxID=588596 RepID=A0A2I1GAA2_9GLOM|nr:hypothetical protein RhiirA4_457570 [Rhizophagus irregularis]
MAIRNMLHEMAGNETKTPLLVLAPMGVAAFNIRGRTVNSALSKPICNSNNNLDINGGRLKTITANVRRGEIIIIDEKNMIGHRMLALFTASSFSRAQQRTFRWTIDYFVWGLWSASTRARSSHEILASRIEDNQSREERNRISDAIFILPRWIDVDAVNMKKLRSLNRPVAKILAVHSGREAKNADSDTAKGFTVSRRDTYQRIMLTANLWTAAGGLTLPKAKIDLGTKEFAACPSFVAVSRVRALKDLFSPFSFERLERIKFCIGVECHYQKLLCQNRIEKSQPLTISKAWNNLTRQIPRNNDGEILNASEFIQCDDNLEVDAMPDIEEIVAAVCYEPDDNNDNEIESEIEIKTSEALESYKKEDNFSSQKGHPFYDYS